MKTHLLIRLASLGTLFAAVAGTAHAQESNYYLGVSAGRSHSQLSEADTTASLFGAGNGASLQSNEQQDTAYKVFGGYQFNRNFGLELGYFNLGQFSYRAASSTGTLNGTYAVDGLNLDLIGTLPLSERFAVFGRIGAQYANTRDSFSGTGTLMPTDASPGKRETNLKLGLGIQYDISSSFQVRAEAERYRINDALDNRADVNVYSLSLVFPFGRKAAAPLAVTAPAVYVAPVVQPAPEPAPVTKVPRPVELAPVAPPPPAPRAPTRVHLAADSLFGYDQAVLGVQGKAALDAFAKSTEGVKFESISVEGHADRLGSAAHNDRLSLQRAEAVKAYLATLPQMQNATINASGKGMTNPLTKPGECVGTKRTKALIDCLQPDRRVDVELTGVR